MCGIVGYTGKNNVDEILLKGLKRLEYRGYDSAGIAILDGNDIYMQKSKGRIKELDITSFPKGRVGIGHTRWATHGKPSDENSHPFLDCSSEFVIVHNGIIDNFIPLKEEMQSKGHAFSSETDSEVIVHMIEEYYDGDLVETLKKVVKKLKGSFAVCALQKGSNSIAIARNQSPLVIGIGAGENMVASDVPAILDYTNEVKYLLDGDVAELTPSNVRIWNSQGELVHRDIVEIEWAVEDAEKGGYEHYMLKEIYEQPKAIHESLLGRLVDFNDVDFNNYNTDFIRIISCGTSYHAALVGKYIIEDMARIPCTTELASEYRYSSPSELLPFTILITQSGETADTVAAAKEARQRGCKTLALTNVMNSSITREVDEVVFTHAGPEIGVAATKTFTTQLIVLYLIAMELGLKHKKLLRENVHEYRDELRRLPRYVKVLLDQSNKIKKVSEKLVDADDIFFVGRHLNYPVALEGALKLKEIAYIHSAGYPAGELKHGPFALLTERTPVVAILIKDHTFEKMLGNIGEIASRGSPIIAVGDHDDELKKLSDELITIPSVPPMFSPILVNVVLQLLAYYTAYNLGCAIDKPRNLAKSVTVE
ncbi:MAG: glutamine--fructose-6-phosphate transaminase (isomerizing) [Thermoplasmata archaeon]